MCGRRPQCKFRSLRAHAHLSACSIRLVSLNNYCNGVFAIKACSRRTLPVLFRYIDHNVTATSHGLLVCAIRRTYVVSLVFRQHIETNVNVTVFRVRLSLSNYYLQHTSTGVKVDTISNIYNAATPCSMVYLVAGVQIVVNQVAGTQVLDQLAGAQVAVNQVAGAQVVVVDQVAGAQVDQVVGAQMVVGKWQELMWWIKWPELRCWI